MARFAARTTQRRSPQLVLPPHPEGLSRISGGSAPATLFWHDRLSQGLLPSTELVGTDGLQSRDTIYKATTPLFKEVWYAAATFAPSHPLMPGKVNISSIIDRLWPFS
jgi:hypothetical protein